MFTLMNDRRTIAAMPARRNFYSGPATASRGAAVSQTSRSGFACWQRLADLNDAVAEHVLRVVLRTHPRSS